MDKRIQRKKLQDGEKAVDRRGSLPEPVEVDWRRGEGRKQDAHLERIRKKDEDLKAQTEKGPQTKGTWTYRLSRRENYRTGSGRLTDDFAEVSDESSSSEELINQQYAMITNESETLASFFASSCLYVCLVDHEKELIGLAHVDSTSDISEFLDEWLKFTDSEHTTAYLVKGNGRGENQSATDIIQYNRKQLTDRDITIAFEDINKPVADEPRGDNMTSITLHKDGRAKVERYHEGSKGIRGGKTVYEIKGEKAEVIED